MAWILLIKTCAAYCFLLGLYTKLKKFREEGHLAEAAEAFNQEIIASGNAFDTDTLLRMRFENLIHILDTIIDDYLAE